MTNEWGMVPVFNRHNMQIGESLYEGDIIMVPRDNSYRVFKYEITGSYVETSHQIIGLDLKDD